MSIESIMNDLTEMIKYIKYEKNAVDTYITEKLEVTPDYTHLLSYAENREFEFAEKINQAANKALEDLEETPMLNREYTANVDHVKAIKQSAFNYVNSKQIESKIIDNFFNEISVGVDEKKAEAIKKFIISKGVISNSGFGEAEVWFNELKEL